MRDNKIVYNIINFLVILTTAFFFAYDCRNFMEIFAEESPLAFVMLVGTVILVHLAKIGRLYLALYGFDITLEEHIKTYCKVMPVSVVIPFKIGEFFRMFCYGNLLGNALSGVIIILLDRFMDTFALISIILLAKLILGWEMDLFVYFLIAVLVFVLIVYHVFPKLQDFWRKYLLKAKASEGRLKLLRLLKRLNGIYRKSETIIKGRGIILYFISLIAWVVEIGNLYVLNLITGAGKAQEVIYGYLKSAIGGSQTVEAQRFVIVSVVLLISVYGVLKISETVSGRKKIHEDNRHI